VGILFTAGCALPVWSRMLAAGHTVALWRLAGPVVLFALLAWLNCYSIECWESRPEHSCTGPHRPPQVLAQATLLAVAGLLLAVLVAPAQPRSAALLVSGAAGALLLALLDCFSQRLSPVALRAAADLALLTPVLLASLVWLPQ